MATYAIGDIHGAGQALETLLDTLARKNSIERLWFVGDLVNRGPDSLAVLRRIKRLGETAITVLGNHDLALLAALQRDAPKAHTHESLHALIDAPDRTELLEWLRHRPILYHDRSLNWTMVHAGIAPKWPIDAAEGYAQELTDALRGPDHAVFLRSLFGNTPEKWDPALTGNDRLRFFANAFTRIRFVDHQGRLNMRYKKTLAGAPESLLPWFCHPAQRKRTQRLVFGHWSALEIVAWPDQRAWGIDTGAAWGGQLTAMQLDTAEPTFVSVSA